MLLPGRACVDCGAPTPALTSYCGACADRHDLRLTRRERRAGG
jgi:ribosomal protein L40E